jgi:hypothetical protein
LYRSSSSSTGEPEYASHRHIAVSLGSGPGSAAEVARVTRC